MSEQLSVALHLAKVMYGEDNAHCYPGGPVSYRANNANWRSFSPRHIATHWVDVVLWAAMNDVELTMTVVSVVCFTITGEERRLHRHDVKHDNTPQSIIDATLKAIALATGWGK